MDGSAVASRRGGVIKPAVLVFCFLVLAAAVQAGEEELFEPLPRPVYRFVGGFEQDPYRWQVAEQLEKLKSDVSAVRAAAAEALGYLRAFGAADELADSLRDESAQVRREAAISLGWCGGRNQVPTLLNALDDGDWVVRQAAWVSLCNLTGMEFEFDALGGEDVAEWR